MIEKINNLKDQDLNKNNHIQALEIQENKKSFSKKSR